VIVGSSMPGTVERLTTFTTAGVYPPDAQGDEVGLLLAPPPSATWPPRCRVPRSKATAACRSGRGTTGRYLSARGRRQ
jgi:hypothetical protein